MDVRKRPNAAPIGMPASKRAVSSTFPNTASSTKLVARRKRKRISVLPIIRVIHIDTPKLVKTDVADFRSTVQNLTGNISNEIGTTHKSSSTADVVQCDCEQLNTPDSGTQGTQARPENIENWLPDLWNICSIADEEETALNRDAAGSFERCSVGWGNFPDRRDIIAGLMMDSGEPILNVPIITPLVDEAGLAKTSVQGISDAATNAAGMKDPWSER